MSVIESTILKEIVDTLGNLGNIGTLSPDEQQQRVNDIMGISPATQRVNIHKLAVYTNLTYSNIMLILRIGLKVAHTRTKNLLEEVDYLRLKLDLSSSPAKLQQQQPIPLDTPKVEKMEIIED
ncbi:hypothetical protein RclHR1_05500004 [Rhizophagus clarus]|uniref:Uncharacterized protein n=1 Tax=Rhizophagus clarus TaxID=94130 RepID=A0A2Z6SFU3_9GLOM|nr:hypothetical protein RclHR1_05500004 [Rhizophagus clarus]GES80866.1 hypothetical protein RCL_jg17711.t1 [Rhizophagus clarus]